MADTFIATEPLFVGRARAHNPGDEVPAENVEKNGWEDKVTTAGPAEAEQLPGIYDPAAHSVTDVNTYLETADDAERDRVLAAERAGKNRTGITGA